MHYLWCNKFFLTLPEATKTYQRRTQVYATEDAPKVDETATACTSSMPAMRVASVVAPSVLILTVVFLSLGMCHKMSRYEKMRIMELESGVRTRSTSDKLFQKVRELKGCRLLAGNSVESSISKVHTTEVGINESCSDNRELLSSPRSL